MGTARSGQSALGTAKIDPLTGRNSSPRLLPLPGGTPRAPRWSPDGQFIAYRAVTDGVWHIWIADLAGRHAHRLTADRADEGEPVWSTDGKWVYYRKEPSSIWRQAVGPDIQARGKPQLWAQFRHIQIQPRSLDLCRDRAVLSITEEARDLWMVDLPEH